METNAKLSKLEHINSFIHPFVVSRMIKCKLFDSIYLNNVTHIIGYAIDIKPNRLIEPRSGNQTYVRDIVLVDHR